MRSHVGEVASLHRRCFEGYFLSVMGDAFLRVIYEDFVANPERNPAFVVLRDGRVVGFVAGTVESKEFYRRLFHARFGGLARAALARAARSSEGRRALLSRTGAVRRAIVARLGYKGHSRQGRSRRQPPPEAVRARLLAIAVAPEARGSGVAETLVAALCRRLAELGHARVGLSVNAENGRAIAFYEKNGWRRDPSEGGCVAFMRSTETTPALPLTRTACASNESAWTR
jgi:ribosomal protein S18 acetylase RimI-like enzyme